MDGLELSRRLKAERTSTLGKKGVRKMVSNAKVRGKWHNMCTI